MSTTLQLGKRIGRTLAATATSGLIASRLFYVRDTHTNTRFLVDTGSEVSVIPPTIADHRHSYDALTLTAVNNTSIHTYGRRSLTLNLGLRRSLPWIFIIADVQRPILGADLHRHYGLMVDMNNRKLVDTCTHLSIQGIRSSSTSTQPLSAPKTTPTPTTNCWLSFLHSLKSLHQTLRCYTTSPTTSKLLNHLCLPVPDDWHLTAYGLPRGNLNTCSSWALSAPLPVPGPLHFTWYLKKHLVTGDPVVTTVLSTATPFLTGIPYHTFMIFLSPYRVPPFSQNWT